MSDRTEGCSLWTSGVGPIGSHADARPLDPEGGAPSGVTDLSRGARRCSASPFACGAPLVALAGVVGLARGPLCTLRLLALLIAAACGGGGPASHEEPPRESGATPGPTPAEAPVTVVVVVVDGILRVADAEVLWVRDVAPAAAGVGAFRLEGRGRTEADGVASLRVPLATSDREYLGIWVKTAGDWVPVQVGACPADPSPFLCDVGAFAEHRSLVSAELRVVDAAGRPVAGAAAEVLVDRRAGIDPTVPRSVAGADGCLVLPPVLREGAWVSVSAAGFGTIRLKPTWEFGTGPDTRRDRVELPQAHAVTVRYRGASTRDVLEVAFNVNGSEQVGAYAFLDGVATVPIPRGPATLIIRRDGRELLRHELVVVEELSTVELE